MVEVTENDDGKTVELAVEDWLHLQLAENPTTGFRWQVRSDGSPACTLGDDAFQPAKGLGQAGTHEWRFKGARPGAGHILLVYSRSWEKDVAPSRTFALDVRVPQ